MKDDYSDLLKIKHRTEAIMADMENRAKTAKHPRGPYGHRERAKHVFTRLHDTTRQRLFAGCAKAKRSVYGFVREAIEAKIAAELPTLAELSAQ
jgi:hypothetical protein